MEADVPSPPEDAIHSDLSRRLQRALLPRNAPSLQGYDIAAGTTLSEEGHGGTIWDWFPLAQGRVALVALSTPAGDFPPAHTLSTVRAFLRELQTEGQDPASLLVRANAAVARTAIQGIDAPVDAAVLMLEPERVGWSAAGTVHGGVLRRDGTMEAFPSGGPPLGLLDGFRYGPFGVSLRSGDVVVALSGGARGLFRGAADVVAELHGRPAGEVVSRLQAALQKADPAAEHSVLFARRS